MGRKAGLSDAKLKAITSDVDLAILSEKEQLAVELADAMATAPATISDEFYVRLRTAFSEEQLLELSAQIAFENYRARLNRVFDIPSDELYRPQAEQP